MNHPIPGNLTTELKIYDAALTPTIQTLLTRSPTDFYIRTIFNLGSKVFMQTILGNNVKFEKVCITVSAGIATAVTANVTPDYDATGSGALSSGFAVYDTTEVFALFRTVDGKVYTSKNNDPWTLEFTAPSPWGSSNGSWYLPIGFQWNVSLSSGLALLFKKVGDAASAHRLYVRSPGGGWASVLTGLPNNGTDITPMGDPTVYLSGCRITGNRKWGEIAFLVNVSLPPEFGADSIHKKWTGFTSFTSQPDWPDSTSFRAGMAWDANANEEWLRGRLFSDNKYGRASSSAPTSGTPTWMGAATQDVMYYQSKYWCINELISGGFDSWDSTPDLISWLAPFNTGSPSVITGINGVTPDRLTVCIAYA
jgi:hypothetical protein